MNHWNKISLYKYQQINEISERKGVPDLDKTLFCTCIAFDMTEYQLDNAGMEKVHKLLNQVSKIFSSPFVPVIKKRIGKYAINYDAGAMTFGQYIELSHYLSAPIVNAQKMLATVCHSHIDWLMKIFSKKKAVERRVRLHEKRAAYFLKQPITEVMGSLQLIRERKKELDNQYKGLFGLDISVHGESAQSDMFNKRYGWIYAASQVAEYERIKLEEAYGLPVRQAFHDLMFLKAKGKYEAEMAKKNAPSLNNNIPNNGR